LADLEDALTVATANMEESQKASMQAADTLLAGSHEAAKALLGRDAANDPAERRFRIEQAAQQKQVDLLTKLLEEAKNRVELKEAEFAF